MLALPLLRDPAAPQDGYKHRDGDAPCGWSASFSSLDSAEDFLKHKPILSPTSTHPHSIFLKVFHPRVKSSGHSLPGSTVQLRKLWQSWDETPLPPGLSSPGRSGTQEAHQGSAPFPWPAGRPQNSTSLPSFRHLHHPGEPRKQVALMAHSLLVNNLIAFAGGCGDQWSFMF